MRQKQSFLIKYYNTLHFSVILWQDCSFKLQYCGYNVLLIVVRNRIFT